MEDLKKGFGAWMKGINWWEKADEIILAGALVPFLIGLTKRIFERLGKKVEGVLGLNLESAKKDTIDDFYFLAAQVNLNTQEITAIYEFKHWLRGECSDKASAFILYIAKLLKTFEREKKESTGGSKGGGKKEECTYKDVQKGIDLATTFFKNLLSKNSNEDKLAFLQCEEVFSIIPDKKSSFFSREELGKAKKKIEELMGELDIDGFIAETTRIVEKGTESLRETSLGREYEGFWKAAFPKKGWLIAFVIFSTVVAIMFVGGLIFS